MAEDREPDLVAGAEGVLGLPGRIRRGAGKEAEQGDQAGGGRPVRSHVQYCRRVVRVTALLS